MSATVTRWWLVRHAPLLDPEGRIYGRTDVACDLRDPGALRGLVRRLPREAQWVITPLRRTRQTAEAIARAGRVRLAGVHVEYDLAEQSYGEWESLTWGDLQGSSDPRVQTFWQSPAHEVPPGGESFAQVVARTESALMRLTARFGGRDVIAVCHAGPIRGALAVALGLDPQRALAFKIDPLSLTRIDHIQGDGGSGVWRITWVNLPCR